MQSWGFIEVVGYIPAVAAADSMVKAADVKLVGCEVIGGGYVTVAVAGEIGAIRTAVDAGAAAAKQAGQLHCARDRPSRRRRGKGHRTRSVGRREGVRRKGNGFLRIH